MISDINKQRKERKKRKIFNDRENRKKNGYSKSNDSRKNK